MPDPLLTSPRAAQSLRLGLLSFLLTAFTGLPAVIRASPTIRLPPPSLVLAGLLVGSPAALALKVEEVTSATGIKAWLVEEHSVPLIAIKFAHLRRCSLATGGFVRGNDDAKNRSSRACRLNDGGALCVT